MKLEAAGPQKTKPFVDRRSAIAPDRLTPRTATHRPPAQPDMFPGSQSRHPWPRTPVTRSYIVRNAVTRRMR
jgi:hypothetical protein